jgi:hypothetical protein
MAVSVKSTVSLDVRLYSLVDRCQCFGGILRKPKVNNFFLSMLHLLLLPEDGDRRFLSNNILHGVTSHKTEIVKSKMLYFNVGSETL